MVRSMVRRKLRGRGEDAGPGEVGAAGTTERAHAQELQDLPCFMEAGMEARAALCPWLNHSWTLDFPGLGRLLKAQLSSRKEDTE